MFSERNHVIILLRIKCQTANRGRKFGMLQFWRFLYIYFLWFILCILTLPFAVPGTPIYEAFLVQFLIRANLQSSDERERCSPCFQKGGEGTWGILVFRRVFTQFSSVHPPHLIFIFRGSLWYQFLSLPKILCKWLPRYLSFIFLWYAVCFHLSIYFALPFSVTTVSLLLFPYLCICIFFLSF